MHTLIAILQSIRSVAGAMAPYLLLGFMISGLLSVWLSPALIDRHLGRTGWRQIVKAALLGIPLPLCSCAVIPVSLSLRRHGAGRGATVSFLVSTPQTGVDSVASTLGLLGAAMALTRVSLAFLTGIAAGWAVEQLPENRSMEPPETAPSQNACTCGRTQLRPAWQRALRYGFVVLPGDMARPLLVGILISGLATALLPTNLLARMPLPDWTLRAAMLGLAVPFYICSTGSIPLALALLHMGVSPGTALVLLVAGPATNAAAVAMVWSRLGRQAAGVYVAVIGTCALLAGWIVDRWAPGLVAGAVSAQQVEAAHGIPLRQDLAALSLLVLMLQHLLPRRRQVPADATA